MVAAAFAASLLVLLVAGSWMTLRALALEREQLVGRQRAALEQRVQLALWRMDSALTAWLSVEGSRSLSGYFLDPPSEPGLAPPPELVRYRFTGAPHERPRLLRSLPAESAAEPLDLMAVAAALDSAAGQMVRDLGNAGEVDPIDDLELAARRKNLLNQQQGVYFVPVGERRLETPLTGVWADEQLLLVRRVRVGRRQELQGAALSLEALQGWLSAEAELPTGARLLPVARAAEDEPRRLALLPLRLEVAAGDQPLPASQLGRGLVFAWGSGLLALVAAAGLLASALVLAERRSAFVSAVTHELRTPLTTFQLYADLLAEGRIPEAERGVYLETLRGEAQRLHHLVENVLDLARLEGRGASTPSWIPAGELLQPMVEMLQRRLSAAGRALAVDGEATGEVLAHPAAVERILSNLTDNALRHGRGEDPRVHLSIQPGAGSLTLRVADHGPGVTPERRRQLFRPFRKSARQAAESAPGVGLGLALSRRLARSMGGELTLAESSAKGATFELRLSAR